MSTSPEEDQLANPAQLGARRPPRFSRRRFLSGAGALTAAALMPAAATKTSRTWSRAKPKVDGDLELFLYATYLAESVVTSFEKEYHVTVHQTYYTTLTELVIKLASGQPYDAALSASMDLVRTKPYLQSINHDALSYWDSEVLPTFKERKYTTDSKLNEEILSQLAVPWYADGCGISWISPHLSDTEPKSFDDFWTVGKKKAKGHIYLWTTAQFTLCMALAKLGYSINSTEPKELNDAAEVLLTIKPYVSAFVSNNSGTMLQNGEGWLDMLYSGVFYRAYTTTKSDARQSWHFARCTTNLLYGATNWVMPKTASHPGTAMLWFDWLLRPDNMKANVDYIGYRTTTKAGVAAFDAIVKAYPFMEISEAQIGEQRNWVGDLYGSNLKLWNDTWTRVIA